MEIRLKALIVLILFGFNFQAFSQGKDHHRGHKPLFDDNMVEKLELSEDQVTQLEALKSAHKADLQQLKEASADTNKREAMKELRKKHKEELKALFTDEQQAKFEIIKKEKREEHKAFREANRGKFKEVRSQLNSYKNNNITPVILAERQNFDKLLTNDEKARLAQIRTALAEHKAERKATRKGKEGARPQGPRKKHHRRGALSESDRDFVKSLSEKYESELQAISEKLQPQKEQWKNDMKEIKDNVMGQEQLKAGKKHHKQDRVGIIKHKFIIMDPNKTSSDLGELPFQENTHDLNVFPNPSPDAQKIQFYTEQKGQVTVELYDETGRKVKTLFEGVLDSGNQSLDADVNGIDAGVYFYRIQDASGLSNAKVIIQ